jgi:hypothetical protein
VSVDTSDVKRALATSAAAAVLLLSSVPATPVGAADVPGTTCSVFPADNA